MTRKQRTSSLKKTVSLKTLITSLFFFVSDLKYSWCQDRKSMEYSVENQIANQLIAMGEENNSIFIKMISYTQNLVAVHSFNFKEKKFQLNLSQCNLLSAMWHVTRPDKGHLKYNVLQEPGWTWYIGHAIGFIMRKIILDHFWLYVLFWTILIHFRPKKGFF